MRWIAIALLTLHAPLAHALPWPGQGGGLYATIKHFKDFDSCIKQLTKRLPAEAALMMLGKRIELTCRAYQAAANDDASACKSLSDYRQRGECEQFYAIYAGRVKQCPMRGYPRHAEGFCAALARRDPALCRAAAVETQPLCKALLSGAAGCSKLSGLDKSRCVGATRLFRGLIKGIKPSLPKTFKPKLEMSASVISGAITLPSNAAKFSSNRVAHGILLADKAGSGDWLVINSSFAPHDAYRRSGRPPMNLELQVPISTLNTKIKLSGGANGSGKVNFTVRSPSYRYVQMSSVTGEAKITKLERKIGGRVMATFWLELTDGVDRIRVNGTLDTFVRDLVPLSRVANYMRYRTKPKTHRYSYNRGKLTLDELTWFKARIKKNQRHQLHRRPRRAQQARQRHRADPLRRLDLEKPRRWLSQPDFQRVPVLSRLSHQRALASRFARPRHRDEGQQKAADLARRGLCSLRQAAQGSPHRARARPRRQNRQDHLQSASRPREKEEKEEVGRGSAVVFEIAQRCR
jgi:hypothetical protein